MKCAWGHYNQGVDCAGPSVERDGHTFCEIHADCIEWQGWPVWLAIELCEQELVSNTR